MPFWIYITKLGNLGIVRRTGIDPTRHAESMTLVGTGMVGVLESGRNLSNNSYTWERPILGGTWGGTALNYWPALVFEIWGRIPGWIGGKIVGVRHR